MTPHIILRPQQSTSSFLKEIVAEVVPVLSIVFQASLDQGVLPDIWKTDTIVSVHKKGNQTDCSN